MPTGYTAGVQDGKITEFSDFALNCARAFGALITMRDDPQDTPIPEKFEARTSYYDERLENAKDLMTEILTLTDDDCDKRAFEEYRTEVKNYEGRAKERENQQQIQQQQYERIQQAEEGRQKKIDLIREEFGEQATTASD